jgi:tricorn protease
MKVSVLACSILLTLNAVTASAASNAYFRFPSIHADQVVFTAEGDLWSVAASGGTARRLTTHEGEESRASISPDGRSVAFVASYAGVPDVWVMPVQGGQPRRLSFGEQRVQVLGWAPDGKVLYSTWADRGPSALRVIAEVDPVSLKRAVLPLGDVTDATFDDTGKVLFVVRNGIATSSDNARHYRGGEVAEIWRYEPGSGKEAVRLPLDAPARRPMWWQGRLYVISDRDGIENMWSMLPDGSDLRQLTHHKDFDIRSASLDAGHIVYQLGADLHVFDIVSGEDRTMDVQLASDFRQMQPRVIRDPLKWVESARLSPDGERVAIVARGHAALAGLQQIRRVDVASAPAVRLRQATLSKDEKSVYAISNVSGEDQIWRLAADGSADARQLTQDKAGYRTALVESPDGKWIAHQTRSGQTWLLDVASGENRRVDSSRTGEYNGLVWSADSRTLALVRPDTTIGRNQVLLYSLTDKTTHVVTSDKYESTAPAFSPDGKWLYFLSERNFSLKNDSPWGDRNTGPVFERRSRVYALALQEKAVFPFQPRTELDVTPAQKKHAADTGMEEKSAREDKTGKADKAGKGLPGIDWNGLSARLYELPVKAGNYTALAVNAERIFLLDNTGDEQGALKAVSIADNTAPVKEIAAKLRGFSLSADGQKLLLQRGPAKGNPEYLVLKADVSVIPADLSQAIVRLGDWSITIDPRAEWRGMFEDAWRMHRDFFFDKNMRGADWEAIRRKYEPLAARAADRLELADVLAQMSGELGALHSQVAPGDTRTATDGGAPAFLGAILEKLADGYKVAHRYQGDAELPGEASPLATAGLDIRDGDIIVSVNGRTAAKSEDISELLVNQAGQQVLLEVRRGNTNHKIVVVPVTAERNNNLRYADWEECVRQEVERTGKGRIGYLHLRAMGKEDIATFVREFYANTNRDGLIIDVRRNNGGNIDSWVIEKLLRRAWAFWTSRNAVDAQVNMQNAFRGQLVVLIDGHTYSDGETFAAGIKALGLGPLIGERTAGAGVWLSDDNRLVDGGLARAAEMPQFDVKTGAWLVEGVGVQPDIAVVNPPNATFRGEDLQLKAALQWLDTKLATNPVQTLQAEPLKPLQ